MFKKLFLLTAAAVTTVGARVVPNPENNAALTCDNWSLLPNTATLSASCANVNGNFVQTTIPISNCVANDNGNLNCRANGGAGSSCVFFNIQSALGSFFTISAHCTTASGGSNTVNNFDMNNCLTNQNGKLTC